MKVFITGINGFVGSHFLEMAMEKTDWEFIGFDISSDNITQYLDNPRLSMKVGDIFKEEKWLYEKIKECDVLLPLVGIARPAYYVTRPLWTFELDFEQNLKMVRKCAEYNKRVIFPSTSEVYGMPDKENPIMDEDSSKLITGPVSTSRWIYSCSKQMMDRVIFAFGQEKNLSFTLFRPFNWIGPRLDSFKDAKDRKGRSITQFMYDILYRGEVTLVNGGNQRRSFTYVKDAMEALLLIVENKGNKANNEVFNIGNPDNNYSIKEFAEILISEMKKFPRFKEKAENVKLIIKDAKEYYGKNYDDMENRTPSVKKMENLLSYKAKTNLQNALYETLKWYDEHPEYLEA